MLQTRLLILTLRPSFVSGVGVLVAGLCILVTTNWSYFTYNPQLYNVFYGQFGVTTAFEGAPNVLNGWREATLNSSLVYGVGVVVIATVVILFVFESIHLLVSVWRAAKILKRHTGGDWYELRERLIIRAIVSVIWLTYTALTIAVFVPFCLLLSRIGAEDLGSADGLMKNIIALGLLLLILHMHVVFVRLFCLRPRVFGSQRFITAAFLSKGS